MSSQPPHLPAGVHWIGTQDELSVAIPRMAAGSELAIDTEADSYYAYRVKVCLIQVSSRTEDWLIDPLTGLDLRPFGALCADPAIRKVFHAASNDVALLRRIDGFSFANLFDTMVAAQVLGLRRPGLAALLFERFGVDQKKTFQTSDWSRRPLTEGQLHYAAADTRHLLPLMDQLGAELLACGRAEEAAEDFVRLETAEQTERGFDPDAWQRAPGAFELDPRRIQVLRELFLLRDQLAAARDRAPHRVFRDDLLVALARACPGDRAGLRPLRRAGGWQPDRDGDQVLEAVRRGLAQEPWVRQRRQRRPGEVEVALSEPEKRVFEALREWRRERARQRDVEESRVATTGTLRNISRAAHGLDCSRLSGVEGMTPFRVREYGEEIVAIAARALVG
jgi:ribonuclease D